MASAVAPPATPKTSTATPTLYQTALDQAKAALAAAQAPVQAQQTQSDTAFKSREQDATDSSAALADLLKGIGPSVAGTYQAAAQNQGLLAQGFSQGMQDALKGNTDNLNSMLEQLHSPTHLDSHTQEAGDVLYGLGGYTPASTFSREGAAFGAAADMLPGTALLHGQEQVKSLKAQAITADQGFQNKLAEMAGNLPGDVATNYQHLQTLALQSAKFREQVAKDKMDSAYKSAELKLAYAKYSTDVGYKNAQLKLSGQRLSLDASYKGQQLKLSAARLGLESQRLAQSQYNSDRSYGLSLSRLGIEQKRLQLSILKSSFQAASGGLSKKDVAKYTSVAQSIAMQGLNGYTTYTTVKGVKTSQQVGKVSYFEALQQALKKGIPVQMALDALDRVYPAKYRPTDEQLAKQLGPLDPQALMNVARNKAAFTSASIGIGDPIGLVTHGASTILNAAKTMLGTPYVWGGTAPGKALDCSGFIQQVYRQIGVSLPRTTYDQVKVGTPVNVNHLKPGDLVFTEPGRNGPNHVGLYVGNGMIQESPHTGDVNKYIDLHSFLGGGFVAARRVLNG